MLLRLKSTTFCYRCATKPYQRHDAFRVTANDIAAQVACGSPAREILSDNIFRALITAYEVGMADHADYVRQVLK